MNLPKSSVLRSMTPASAAAKQLMEQEEQVEAQYRKLSEGSFMLFCRGIYIKAQNGKKRFERVMAPFQRTCFEEMAESLQQLRDGDMPDKRRWWIERTKKASKDADLAVVIAWLVAFPTRPFYGQIGAADRGQAGIVRDRLSDLLFYNPWLNDKMELIGNEIRSKVLRQNGKPLALIDIESSDVTGSHGGTPDILIVNELSHITRFEFAETMLDNADGVAQGMVLIATNAGYKNTKPWQWRCAAIASPEWAVHLLSEAAPWHTNKTLQEARKRNTKSRFARLWKGEWVAGGGDVFDEVDIDAIFCLEYPDVFVPQPGWDYIAGLDLGITNDHAGFVIMGVNQKIRKIRLAYMKRWDPRDTDGEVDLQDVENTLLAMCLSFRTICLFYDPHQAVFMAQRARKKITVREMTFSSGKNLTEMASALKQAVESRMLELFDEADGSLRKDFDKFKITEKSYGYKIEATRDDSGHADVGTALAIVLPAAISLMNGSPFLTADDDIAETDPEEMTEEEIAAMPEELKEIYGMDEPEEPYESSYFEDLE